MSGHKSFDQVVSDWLDAHIWPIGTNEAQSIVVISKKNASGTVFEFQSGLGYLQINGIYNNASNTLVDVQIQIVAPGHPAITVAEADSYLVSTTEGISVSFDLENGYVKGSVSFKYGSQDGRRDIFATFDLDLPFAAEFKGIFNAAPTEVTEGAGFTATELKDIAQFTPSELKDVEEKALKSGKPAIRALNTEELALFVKFLKDFVIEDRGIIIETYYPPPSVESTLVTNFAAERSFAAKVDDKSSKQWHASISFLDVLELDASVDPRALTITATLFGKAPILGRVQLTKIQGSLAGGGVTVNINVAVATGKVTFSASKNKDGKHDLFVEADINIRRFRPIKTKGKQRIAVLPF